MKNPHDVILKPVITERSTTDAADGKYTFKVERNATKTEIRQACEILFNVKVLKVNTVTMNGKEKRVGANKGMTASWKKAVVTIDTNPATDSYLLKGAKKAERSKKYNSAIEEFGYGQ